MSYAAAAVDALQLDPDLERQLLACFAPEQVVMPLQWDGRRAWIKRVDVQQGRSLRLLRRVVIRWLRALGPGLPASPPIERGNWPLEAARLHHYQAQGLAVPAVLAVGQRLFVMEDAGPSFRDTLDATEGSAREPLLRAALENLIAWHRGGHWHGGAQLRNLALGQQGLVRLDFEEPYGGQVPTPVLQVIDLCQQLASAERYQSDPSRRRAVIRWFGAVGTPETARVSRRLLRWLALVQGVPLLRFARYEYRRLAAAVAALRQACRLAEECGYLRPMEAPQIRVRWRAALVAVSLLLVSDDLLEFVETHDYDDDAPRLIYGMEPPDVDREI